MLKNFYFEDMICAQGSRNMPWNPSHKMHVYYYLIDGLLIDSGPFSLASEAIHFFNSHTIKQVFLTHIHEDHAGMAYWLQGKKQVPVYLHPGSVDEALQEPELLSYRLEIWGKRKAFKAEPSPETIYTDNYIFDVIDSPGHYPYHKVLYEKKNKWLFSGDLLANLKPKSVFYDENMSDMISSLKHILTLDFNTVFCTHTGILQNGRQLFTRKLEYLLQLQETIRDLGKKGLNNEEIDRQLFPEPGPIGQLTRGDFSSYNIVSTI